MKNVVRTLLSVHHPVEVKVSNPAFLPPYGPSDQQLLFPSSRCADINFPLTTWDGLVVPVFPKRRGALCAEFPTKLPKRRGALCAELPTHLRVHERHAGYTPHGTREACWVWYTDVHERHAWYGTLTYMRGMPGIHPWVWEAYWCIYHPWVWEAYWCIYPPG